MHEREVVLSVNRLRKKLSGKWIIKGISFEVYAGEIFGFLGPNGSGKTTTIRMLVDLIEPTEGSVEICGYDVHKAHNQALRNVGCIVENPELYSYLSGWENLEHFARMLPGVGQQRIQEVVDIVGMDQRIHDKVRTYSLGMRQRLGIAQALLGYPKLLILDEPTNGLDPQGIKEMREFIKRLAATGLSLFVSSHLLSEIQMMCDRVAIISHGEVLQVGEVDTLIAQAGGRVVWNVQPVEQALSVFAANDHIQVAGPVSADDSGAGVHTVTTQMNEADIPDLTAQMVAAGVRIYGVETRNPTLEDLFLNLTEGERIG
ncbi:ABC transporter ATP-binding protein [Paenibacillus thalictri]|uniref:ABC transporter ATP-binding protein n=1 Tax=Paenibacillus thalictri TaxID=2527873 RepID=A0A4Q9DGD9_9BACL|nr:ABC transporter ATP-binding protein [Paenibacillus thalictri]TBL68568.1 ABC transporter ATP-binding protein [Paenibacillus thalictri]